MTDGAPHEYKETPGSCAACGNSPVNHAEHYVSNTLAVWTAEAFAKRRGPFYLVSRMLGRLFDALEQGLLRTLAALPVSRFSRAVAQAATYRSQVIWEEAQRRGIEMEQLFFFGKATEIYRARMGGAWFYFQSLPIPHGRRRESVNWLDDKYLLKRVLREAGVSAPASFSATTIESAKEAMRRIAGPAVVKPRSGSRGRHTAVRVFESAETEKFFAEAQQLCRYVAVEAYLEGPVCRGTVINGRLAGFFEARPPMVAGDGAASINELIARANESRPERVQPIRLTAEHDAFLARQGLSRDSVLENGRAVALTHRTGRLFGGTTREMLGREHPKLRAELERAASVLDIAVVGFDLIIPDPERDPDEQSWGIIEANSLPYIDLHYLALEGAPSPVAAAVWDLWQAPMHSAGVDARERSVTMGA